MAGTGAIFRIDANLDTEATARTANEIIEFNTGSSNPDARSHLEQSEWSWKEDISIHGTPKKALNRIQDNLLGTRELILSGYFSEPAVAGGIAKLSNWMKDAKTNASLPRGRFGVRQDDLPALDINPSATTAYILYDVNIKRPEGRPNEATFLIRLYLNGVSP